MSSIPTMAIEQELSSGERLIWSGQPRSGLCLRPSDAFVIPFSLVWCGFAIFWETSVISRGAPFFFRIWGIPFVLIGLYFVFGRFIADASARGKTYYGVTTERVIIVSGQFSRQTKSISLKSLSDIGLTERPDGSGTISFGPMHPMMQRVPAGWPGAGQYAAPAFDMIPDAKTVYELIRQAQKAAK